MKVSSLIYFDDAKISDIRHLRDNSVLVYTDCSEWCGKEILLMWKIGSGYYSSYAYPVDLWAMIYVEGVEITISWSTWDVSPDENIIEM